MFGRVWELLPFIPHSVGHIGGITFPWSPGQNHGKIFLTAGSHFEEGEVEHDLIKRENCVNDFKISLGIGSTTWFSLRWCQNLRQSHSLKAGNWLWKQV